MNNASAQTRLDLALRGQRLSARSGAFATSAVMAVLVIAIAVIVDLDKLWLLGLAGLGFVGLSLARPLRLRLDWSDRTGVALFIGSIIAVAAAYVLTQALVRASGWIAPNTLSAFVAAVVIFAACTPALIRLSTKILPTTGQARLGDA